MPLPLASLALAFMAAMLRVDFAKCFYPAEERLSGFRTQRTAGSARWWQRKRLRRCGRARSAACGQAYPRVAYLSVLSYLLLLLLLLPLFQDLFQQ
jgi:hypothetical protein